MTRLNSLIIIAVCSAYATPGLAGDVEVRQAMERLKQSKIPPAELPATITETHETYEVGAQFRGAVKRGFRDLGSGELDCRTLGPDRFSVRLKGQVKHPDKPEVLQFDICREFKVEKGAVQKLVEKDVFNEAASQYRKKLIDTVSLAYLVKWRSPRSGSSPHPALSYVVDGRKYSITFASESRWLEATLRDPEGAIARFFLKPPEGGVRPVEKFRIFAKNNLLVSFAPPERGVR